MIFGVCVSPASAGKPRRPEKKARLLVSFGADDMTTFPDITSVVQEARQTSDKSRLKIQARRPAQFSFAPCAGIHRLNICHRFPLFSGWKPFLSHFVSPAKAGVLL